MKQAAGRFTAVFLLVVLLAGPVLGGFTVSEGDSVTVDGAHSTIKWASDQTFDASGLNFYDTVLEINRRGGLTN
jgi:hypothetical protein